jgi:hypothetical protein
VEFVESFPRTLTKNEIARYELRERGVGRAWDAQLAAAADAAGPQTVGR